MTSGSRAHFGRRPVLDHPPDVERRDAVADAEDEIGVVLDQQHADARIADGAQQPAEMLDLRSGQATGRFVEQDEARPQGEAACNLQEALLRMLEEIGAAMHRVAEADAVQQLRCLLAQGLDRSRRPTAARRAWRRSRTGCGSSHRESRCRARTARRAAAASGRFERCRAPPGAAPSPARARARGSGSRRGRLVVARQQVQHRRLAAAVGTDEAVDLARPKRQRDVVERGQAAEALGHPGGDELVVFAGCRRGCLRDCLRSRWRGGRCGGVDVEGGLAATHRRAPRARASRGRSGDTGTLAIRRGRRRSAMTSKTRPMPSGTSRTTASSSRP